MARPPPWPPWLEQLHLFFTASVARRQSAVSLVDYLPSLSAGPVRMRVRVVVMGSRTHKLCPWPPLSTLHLCTTYDTELGGTVKEEEPIWTLFPPPPPPLPPLPSKITTRRKCRPPPQEASIFPPKKRHHHQHNTFYPPLCRSYHLFPWPLQPPRKPPPPPPLRCFTMTAKPLHRFLGFPATPLPAPYPP